MASRDTTKVGITAPDRRRRPLVILTCAGVTLATLVATLATTTTAARSGWVVLSPITWPELTAAILATTVISVAVVLSHRPAERTEVGR